MKETATYYIINRNEWKHIGTEAQISMTDRELQNLAALNDQVSLRDVEEVYLPLIAILDIYLKSYLTRQTQVEKLLQKNSSHETYIIGIAGSVAVGKSTLARLLQAILSQYYKELKVDLITTDGFLYPNKILEEKDLMSRKGFPESYDMRQLTTFMADVKSGQPAIKAPVYSHDIYDIVPDEYQVIDHPDILIVEGINTLQLPPNEKIYASDFFDFSFYVDAEPENIEKWYLSRFGVLIDTAFQNPNHYHARFVDIDRMEAFKYAKKVWQDINYCNLVENILPTRSRADIIVHKSYDHYIDKILLRKY